MASVVGNSSGGKTILTKLYEKIAGFLTSAKREEELIEHLANKQLTADTLVLAICYEAWQKAEADLKKIDRADDIRYDKDRKPVREEYTAGRLDEIKKVKDRIDKIEKVIAKAIENGEMKDAREIAQQHTSKDKGSGGGKSPETTPSETS